MTEEDALALYDFLNSRILGWDTPLASNNPRGMRDFRTKATRNAYDLMTDIMLNRPDFADLIYAIQNDEDPVALWPTELQDVVRFRLWHTVPREINEPLSKHGYECRQHNQGLDPWPDFLKQYAKPATVADHPPYSPKTKVFIDMEGKHSQPVAESKSNGSRRMVGNRSASAKPLKRPDELQAIASNQNEASWQHPDGAA